MVSNFIFIQFLLCFKIRFLQEDIRTKTNSAAASSPRPAPAAREMAAGEQSQRPVAGGAPSPRNASSGAKVMSIFNYESLILLIFSRTYVWFYLAPGLQVPAPAPASRPAAPAMAESILSSVYSYSTL